MLNFVASSIRYDPYPLVVLRPALDPALYEQLCENYPPIDEFGRIPKYDYKLSLSEKFNANKYHAFLARNDVWGRFHAWIKSDDFIRQTADFLVSNHIDLQVQQHSEPLSGRFGRTLRQISRGKLPSKSIKLRSRFEFSVLKADGGEVAPHTDTPKKIITLVLSMVKEGEWEHKLGGSLDINRVNDVEYAFNWINRIVPWDKVEVIDTVPFVPNQCVVFVKTFNSLHSVRKMAEKGSNALRKTVTIVIEHDE